MRGRATRDASRRGTVLVGISGYDYPGWRGAFYPPAVEAGLCQGLAEDVARRADGPASLAVLRAAPPIATKRAACGPSPKTV